MQTQQSAQSDGSTTRATAVARNPAFLADYFTDEEMALSMGVCLRTWLRWLQLREGPPSTRLGKRRYFHRDAVEKWLRSREQAA